MHIFLVYVIFITYLCGIKINSNNMEEKKLKKVKTHLEISNNLINTNVVWDQATMDVVADVAQALLNLTQLFTMQNIEIRGINVEQTREEV